MNKIINKREEKLDFVDHKQEKIRTLSSYIHLLCNVDCIDMNLVDNFQIIFICCFLHFL